MARRTRLVVVANRLPVQRSGSTGKWQTSPGGLVAALHPVLEQRGGVWIGWAGGGDTKLRPFTHDGIDIHPVPMTEREVRAAYHGMSNATLWPLYHDAIRTPEFSRDWWAPYVEVNQRFADRTLAGSKPGDLIWIHDFHLQLAPAMIREKRPKARIGFFLHIPFPPEELFAWLPWRTQILEGLLGADVVGFQTREDAVNFSRLARRFTSARGSDTKLTFQGRTISVRAFPISIDFESFDSLSQDPAIERAASLIRERLDPGRIMMLCVDRLDYTKGIDGRLLAFEHLLRRGVVSAENCVLVQVAVPTRDNVPEYAAQRVKVEQIVGRINGEFSRVARVPVHYFRRNLGRRELVSYYRAADVMLVTPLRDGMNLVAKEFVASRHDNTGVLMISEFAGAARELTQAITVNPRDVDAMSDSMLRATKLPRSEITRRMRSMRSAIQKNTVFDWCDSFIGMLES